MTDPSNAPAPSTTVSALSVINDLESAIHGKAGPDRAAAALDLVSRIAAEVAEISVLVPGGQAVAAIAGTVAAGAAALEDVASKS